MKLFLYDNSSSCMRLFQRPLIRELARSGRFELAIGCCCNDACLFEDLVGDGVRLLVTPYQCASTGSLVDLLAWRPEDHLAIDLSFDAYEDTRSPQWKSVLTVANRQLASHGIDVQLPYDEGNIPMLDFLGEAAPVQLRRPAIYLDSV